TLSAAGLPSGASATFNPPSITGSGTSTVTITTTPGVSAGPHTVNITGASGSLSDSVPVNLIVDLGAPNPSSATPSSGSGLAQTFSVVVSDPDGASDVAGVNILFNASLSGSNGCWMFYDAPSNTLAMASDDTSNWTQIVLGSSSTLQNSQCSVN